MYRLCFITLCCLVVMFAHAGDYVLTDGSSKDFVLANQGKVSAIYIDEHEPEGLKLAVANLQVDFENVTGVRPQLNPQKHQTASMIIIGTLGHSALIQQLIAQGKLDISPIKNQWEAFQIQLVSQPIKGVESALVIVGSDMRGAIFGAYDLSENIGVSPWYWWADVAINQQKKLFVKADTYKQQQPKVRYRGIFLNDEAPALSNWVHEKFGEYNSDFYQHVFELLLRLKANFLWPAMWNNAFSLDDPNNPQLADTMGIVMGTSHHEPMMRADKEWNRVGTGKWDYAVNADNLYQFWQAGAQRHRNLESVFTLGMRGQADEPMGENENIALLEKIVADQRKILSDTFGKDKLSAVPQVWALYKEVQSYYEHGMRVPDDVTLLWSDDNWGNLRRLPTPQERKRSGGAGVYYHFDYVGGPRSYRWINTVPISKIWEQMQLAYQYQADRIWLTNVGDLKPMEYPTDFFLRMAWDPEQFSANTLIDYGQRWAEQQFGKQYANDIEKIMSAYTRHNGRRKPELMAADTYSLLHYQEAQRISDELQTYVTLAENIYAQLPNKDRDAFFQLVLHPIKATAIVYELNYSVAQNHLYAKQGRASTNEYAKHAQAWFAADLALQQQYHALANGRWNHFMDQTHIGYTHWNNPPANVMPAVSINQAINAADMGVAVEGNPEAWPATGQLALNFDYYGQTQRYVDVFNRGLKPFNVKIETSAPWIKLNQDLSQITREQRLEVSIDWSQVSVENVEGYILIKGTGWGGAKIAITAFKPKTSELHGFIEADGYVSIEPASGEIKQQSTSATWQKIDNHGRTGSSMTGLFSLDKRFSQPLQAPYLEYDVHLFHKGFTEIVISAAPSLDFTPNRGLHFAVSLGEEAPKIVNLLADYSTEKWEQSVKNGTLSVTLNYEVKKAGAKTLRIYALESGLTLQNIIINTGGLKASYLGPQQSRYLP